MTSREHKEETSKLGDTIFLDLGDTIFLDMGVTSEISLSENSSRIHL